MDEGDNMNTLASKGTYGVVLVANFYAFYMGMSQKPAVKAFNLEDNLFCRG
ncbi:transmembrane protein, putative [Medicago truncatula]|uniref:Transmembrane protein, putative n=1 Tax=Medicago truncatula TaxID=3880 RepID=G7KS04_MEDTR|nr:transmembrane protein, putative [Medicago truncatula]